MDIKKRTENVSFSYIRSEVELLYNLYFAYTIEERSKGPFEIPDSFVLTTAFACIFYELKLTSGYVYFSLGEPKKEKLYPIVRLGIHGLHS